MLLIDHNVALIMDVCDRVHVLDRGRTLAAGTPEEIRRNFDVATAYLGAGTWRWRSSMPERVLELDEVEVRYGSVPAVRNLSLTSTAARSSG